MPVQGENVCFKHLQTPLILKKKISGRRDMTVDDIVVSSTAGSAILVIVRQTGKIMTKSSVITNRLSISMAGLIIEYLALFSEP